MADSRGHSAYEEQSIVGRDVFPLKEDKRLTKHIMPLESCPTPGKFLPGGRG